MKEKKVSNKNRFVKWFREIRWQMSVHSWCYRVLIWSWTMLGAIREVKSASACMALNCSGCWLSSAQLHNIPSSISDTLLTTIQQRSKNIRNGFWINDNLNKWWLLNFYQPFFVRKLCVLMLSWHCFQDSTRNRKSVFLHSLLDPNFTWKAVKTNSQLNPFSFWVTVCTQFQIVLTFISSKFSFNTSHE